MIRSQSTSQPQPRAPAPESSPSTVPDVHHPLTTAGEPIGPMDLVCRRVPAESAWSRSIGAGLDADAYDLVVRLPNPNHPHPRPPVHRHHSTDDVTTVQAWGYAGSGPADLALNVMAAYLPVAADGAAASGREVKLWDGSHVSERAYRYHQAFKTAFLTHMPDAGGHVTEADIRAWIAEQETLSLSGIA